MAGSDSSRKGGSVALRSELRNLSDHALLALEMIREGQPPKSTAPDVEQRVTASDPDLQEIELAAQSLVGAISVYLFNRAR